MRRSDASIKALAAGLKALRLLAQIAPANLHEFCAATNLSVIEGRALIGVFKETGFVQYPHDTAALTLTPLAIAVLAGKESLPDFTATLADPRLGDPATIRRAWTNLH